MSGEENVTIMSGEENATCANGDWDIIPFVLSPLSLAIPYFMILVFLSRPASESNAMRPTTGCITILNVFIGIIVASTIIAIGYNLNQLTGQVIETRNEIVLKLYQDIFMMFAWASVWSSWRVEWKGCLPKLRPCWYEVLNIIGLFLLIFANFCAGCLKLISYKNITCNIRLLRSVLTFSLLIVRIVGRTRTAIWGRFRWFHFNQYVNIFITIVKPQIEYKPEPAEQSTMKPEIEYKSEPAEQSTVKPETEYKSEPAEHSTVKPQTEYKSEPAEQSTIKPESNPVNLQEKELPILNPSATKATDKFINALKYALIRYNTKLVPLSIQEFLKDNKRRTLLICYNDGRLYEDFETATEQIPVDYHQNIYMIVVKPCRKGHGGNACAKQKLGERKCIAEILDMEYDHNMEREGIYDCKNNNEALQVIIGINDKSDC